MAAAWNDVPATGGLSECVALVRSAEALRTSAPELSCQLARRALVVGATDVSANNAHAGEARSLSMRAQAVLTAGLVRTSQHVSAVEPGFAALGLAESGGALVLAAELRLDLAACAQEVGEPLLGGALLRPVLEATSAPPSVRAAALGRLVGCVAHVARRDDIEDALAEADRLLAADDSLAPDARRMERARLAVRSAAYHRWYGDNEDAVTAARDGLTLLSRLRRERRPESDRLHARLVLEGVCALLDEGELHEAETMARPTVDEPVRATSAESVGQLMLALATRVHLPAGEVERGRGLVDQAAWLAERHSLDSVLADALTEVSRLDEQAGRAKEALEAMRAARAAEQRRMRAVNRAARHLLLQVTAAQGVREATQQAVASLLRQLAHPAGVPVAVAPSQTPRTALPSRTTPEPPAPPITGELVGVVDERQDLHEQRTGLLNREGLVSRLRSVRTGERPVALTLVRFESSYDNPAEDRGPDTGIMVGLADKVRGIAPENAELARSDGGELAVLLPHTTRDEAEEFAATIRETATKSGWAADGSGKDMSISTSVVQSDPQAPDTDPHMDADTMLAAARDALTPAQAAADQTAANKDTESKATTGMVETGTEAAGVGPVRNDPSVDVSLAETKAALSVLSAQEQGAEPPVVPTTAETPASALADEPPTTPLNVAQQGGDPSSPAGRSILNSLSIPDGSGGRRRAGGEEASGAKAPRPSESADAPRLTRAERRASEQSSTDTNLETGWPAEPDVSQALYRTGPSRPNDEAPALGAKSSSYDETRAELARMMSTLNAKALRSRSKSDGKTADTPDSTTADAPEPTAADTNPTAPNGYDPAAAGRADHMAAGRYDRSAADADRVAADPYDRAAAGRDDHMAADADRVVADRYDRAAADDYDRVVAGGSGHGASDTDRAAGNGYDAASAESHHRVAVGGYDRTAADADRVAADRYDRAAAGGSDRGVADTDRAAANGYDHAAADASGAPIAVGRLGSDALPGPRQTIPTPPEPDEMPEPPGRPDIPEPPRRPDIPVPPEPEPIPPAGPDTDPQPANPAEPEKPRSGLLAAFDALTGPVLSTSDESADDTPLFRTEFESPTALPSRKPRTSWEEIESASTVDSPADDLFGLPAEAPTTESRLSLGAAFNLGGAPIVDRPRRGLPSATSETTPVESPTAAGSPAETPASHQEPSSTALPTASPTASAEPAEGTATPPAPDRTEWPAVSHEASSNAVEDATPVESGRRAADSSKRGPSTSAELRAALWDRLTTLDQAAPAVTAPAEPAATAPVAPPEPAPAKPAPSSEVSATVGEWSASAPAEPAQGKEHTMKPPPVSERWPSGGTVVPPGDGRAPSGASVAPTYDEPIGPQRMPHGLPRRGERSATTIASLLTEALAAYQSGSDDQQEPTPTPERFDSFVADPAASAGRHRSPE